MIYGFNKVYKLYLKRKRRLPQLPTNTELSSHNTHAKYLEKKVLMPIAYCDIYKTLRWTDGQEGTKGQLVEQIQSMLQYYREGGTWALIIKLCLSMWIDGKCLSKHKCYLSSLGSYFNVFQGIQIESSPKNISLGRKCMFTLSVILIRALQYSKYI